MSQNNEEIEVETAETEQIEFFEEDYGTDADQSDGKLRWQT